MLTAHYKRFEFSGLCVPLLQCSLLCMQVSDPLHVTLWASGLGKLAQNANILAITITVVKKKKTKDYPLSLTQEFHGFCLENP